MDMEIGGYLDVSANREPGGNIFPGALDFNSCAGALEFLVRARGYTQIRLPFYTCPEVRLAVEKAGAEVLTYALDQHCMPSGIEYLKDASGRSPSRPGGFAGAQPPVVADDIPLVYVNYFGLMDDNARALARRGTPLILDNAQALFSPPLPGVDCLYSPRKFFGLPDGGLLYPAAPLDGFADLAADDSSDRCFWLFKRLEKGAPSAYEDMRENERILRGRPVLRMSASTRWLLNGCDLVYAARRRRANWAMLHAVLGELNGFPRLQRKLSRGVVPLCYPFMPAGTCARELRKRLIARKIYIPRYWPGLEAQFAPGSQAASGLYPSRPGGSAVAQPPVVALDRALMDNLLPLPLDQRYGEADMGHLLKTLFQAMSL